MCSTDSSQVLDDVVLFAAKKDYKLPHFLNTEKKWKMCVAAIDTFQKFDIFVIMLLDDDNVEFEDFHPLITDFSEDVVEYHKNPSIIDIMKNINELVAVLNRWTEESAHRNGAVVDSIM